MRNRLGIICAVMAVPMGLVLGTVLKGAASARPVRAQDAVPTQRECGTPLPTKSEVRQARLAAEAVRGLAGVEDALSPTTEITILVVFHVIHRGAEGKVTEGQIKKQIEVLNQAYEQSGIQFKLKSESHYVDVTGDPNRARWFTMSHLSEDEFEAKKELSKDFDPNKYLNVYTANLLGGLLGWATFPSDFEEDEKHRDGVVLRYTTLPAEDGTANPALPQFGLGHTGTHEAGHWLGLYHTFQGGCFPPGDEVDDTAPHRTNQGQAPETTDTCKGDKHPDDPTKPWTDPVHNYMNYTDDAWMSELTERQIQRIREQTTTFRPMLYEVPEAVRASIMEQARMAR